MGWLSALQRWLTKPHSGRIMQMHEHVCALLPTSDKTFTGYLPT